MGCSQICRAIHNTLIHHWSISIFTNERLFKSYWWNPNYSWQNKYKNGTVKYGYRKLFWKINYPIQLTDAWHLFNTFEIFFHLFAVITALYLKVEVKSIKDVILFGIYVGLAYNIPFNIFYNWLLIRNKTLKTCLYEVFIKPFKS